MSLGKLHYSATSPCVKTKREFRNWRSAANELQFVPNGVSYPFLLFLSSYVRKVAIVAKENGTFSNLELLPSVVSPTHKNTSVDKANPLAKVPSLETPQGISLFDSRVIAEYLDSKSTNGRKFFPESGDARWRALRLQALGDGILDAALLARYETFLRPEDKRWHEWSEGQLRKIHNALVELEELEVANLKDGEQMDIGEVSIVCAVGYLKFRFADIELPEKLEAWYAKMLERESVKDTVPKV